MFLRRLSIGLGLGLGVTASGYYYSGFYNYAARTREPIIVVGGGIVGRGTAYALAKRGEKVILIDAGHGHRSSWGESRGTLPHQKDKEMWQLARLGQKIYAEVEKITNTKIFHRIGACGIGDAEDYRSWAATLSDEYDAPCKYVSAEDMKSELPQVTLSEGQGAALTCGEGNQLGGALLTEAALDGLAVATQKAGGVIIEDKVIRIDRYSQNLITSSGNVFHYSKLVLACGPWTNRTLALASLPLLPVAVSIEQTVQFGPAETEEYSIDQLPLIYTVLGEDNPSGKPELVYSIPHIPGGQPGMKVGVHRTGELIVNDQFVPGESKWWKTDKQMRNKKVLTSWNSNLDPSAFAIAQHFVRKHLPGLNAEEPELHMRCPYTMSPDFEFIVGKFPEDPNVVVATGFSGEGFKHGPAIGELITSMLTHHESEDPDLMQHFRQRFDPTRFNNNTSKETQQSGPWSLKRE